MHSSVVSYAINCIKKSPEQTEFLFATKDYDSFQYNQQFIGPELRLEILRFLYLSCEFEPNFHVTIYDIAENFNISDAEAQKWLGQLLEREYVKTDRGFVAAKRANVSVQTYSIVGTNIDKIKNELGLNDSIAKNPLLINLQYHKYFHLINDESMPDEEFAFLCMPFNETEFPQSEYIDSVKAVVKETCGIDCIRLDDNKRRHFIEPKLYSHIVKSKFVIVELSTENKNVVFELGMALALAKEVITTFNTNYGDEEKGRSFDYKHYDTIMYNNYDELKAELKKTLLRFGLQE